MKPIAVNLDDALFLETENLAKEANVPIETYITNAIRFYQEFTNDRLPEEDILTWSA